MQKFLQSDEELLGALASESAFGTSKIQRLAGWGYNRAARKAEEWLKDGKIRPLESTPHRFVLCTVPGEKVGLALSLSSNSDLKPEHQ